MTTLIIISSVITLGIVLATGLHFYLYFSKRENKKNNEQLPDNLQRIATLNWKVKALLIIALIVLIISLYAPFIFTRSAINSDFNFTTTGQIGDTIGGLMNPFIALTAVIVTGLAFYIQYKANFLQIKMFREGREDSEAQFKQQIKHQNDQLKLQQFESQFYEMLKLHRENVTEMRILGYDFEEIKETTRKTSLKKFEKITEGRKVFVTMQTELECILSIYTKDRKLDKEGLKRCYKLFFSGIDEYKKDYPNDFSFIDLIGELRKRHEFPEDIITTNKDRKETLDYAKLNFNYKPFSGHASRLGHYFRHLFLTVKSIANNDIVQGYEERMKYFKLLRAQLSNHEQILLFYNWLSDYGYNWENDEHSFFTEFKMIHNLWYKNLFDDPFIIDKINSLKTKKVEQRNSEMFEIDE